jgi:hypothetical protein
MGQIDLMISLLYIILLGSIGLMMLFEGFFTMMKKKTVRSEFNRLKSPPLIARLPYKMRFARSKLYISALVPGGIGFFSGFPGFGDGRRRRLPAGARDDLHSGDADAARWPEPPSTRLSSPAPFRVMMHAIDQSDRGRDPGLLADRRRGDRGTSSA